MGWILWIKDGEITLGKEINGKDVLMILSYNKEELGSDLSNDNIIEIGHRSHNYNEDYIYEHCSNKKKIIVMGSCNSYRDVDKLKQHYPNSYIITNKITGKGNDNTKANYEILKNIANNNLKWEKFEDDIPEGTILPNRPEILMLDYIDKLKTMYGEK